MAYFPGPVADCRLTRLPNGVLVATAEMPQMASTCVGLWARVGGRHEPAALNGASHFLEHLLFKGTHRRNAREISEAVEGVGGYLNAYTAEEHTCYFARGPHREFPTLFDVLGDMYLDSLFAPREVAKERAVIIEEVAMYRDQPREYVEELLNELIWPEHALGRPLTGTRASVTALRRRDLLAFHRAHYVAGGTLVVAAGRVTHAQVLRLARRFARRLPPGESPGFVPVAPPPPGPRWRLERRRNEQAALALGFRVCSRHDDRRFALRLLNAVLGEHMSSRLFQLVREDHGLAYSIHSALDLFADTGMLTISASVDPGRVGRCLKLIGAELRRLSREAPSARELDQARDCLLGQHALSQENTENHMLWLGEHVLNYGELPVETAAQRRLLQVKPAELRDMTRAFVRPGNLNVALVSPLRAPPRSLQSLDW